MMIPTIALVGRPNVGKSTLFNRLTRTSDALVADFPGLTRDRKYGVLSFEEHRFIVIDTAGIEESGSNSQILLSTKQSLLAIMQADEVFVVVDAQDGLMPTDRYIAKIARSHSKSVSLIVNKTDGLNQNISVAEFFSLGIRVYPVSASHGHGIQDTLKDVILPYIANTKRLALERNEEIDSGTSAPRIKVAIIGRPNVGKSTLANSILGENRSVVCDTPGTTRDSIKTPMERGGYKYILVDTAGVRKKSKVVDKIEKLSVIKTLQSIESSDVVILLIDVHISLSDQDLSLIRFTVSSGRSIVIAVNKRDQITQKEEDKIKDELHTRLRFIDFTRIHFISALQLKGFNNLFKSIKEAYTNSKKRISSSVLTRTLNMAVREHLPPMVNGRRIRLKYAHIGGHSPPTFIVHGNQVRNLPSSYERYLVNYFRKCLSMSGTPIKIYFKDNTNPYKAHRNILTPKQQRKRKRLMLFSKTK